MIRWTESLRRLLTPRVREDVGPPPEPAAAWAQLQHALRPRRNGFDPMAHAFRSQRDAADAERKRRMEAAEAFLRMPERPRDPPARDLAAIIVEITRYSVGSIATWRALSTYGPDLMFDAVLDSVARIEQHGQHWMTLVYAVPLRKVILQAEGDAHLYDRARALFPNASFQTRMILAAAFPNEPKFAAELGRMILADTAMRYPPVHCVFMSLDDLSLVAPLLPRRMTAFPLVDLVAAFGERVLPLLLEQWEKPHLKYDRKHLAPAIAVFESEEVARALAQHLANKDVRDVAIAYFQRFPDLATVLPRTKGRGGRVAGQILKSLRAREASAEEEEAQPEELPWVLVSPPWVEKKKKNRKKKPKALELAPIARAESVRMDETERAKLYPLGASQTAKPMSEEEARAWQAKLESGETVGLFEHEGKLVPAEFAARALIEKRANLYSPNPHMNEWVALARFGEIALPAFFEKLDVLLKSSPYWVRPILGIDSHRLAVLLLPRLDRGKHAKLLWQWMEEHVEAAATGLIPIALGSSRARDRAIEILVRLRAPETIRTIARAYGDDALLRIDEILATDPRFDVPRKTPTLSWQPESLTRPRTKSGKLLPLSAVEHLGTMLAFSTLERPYAGLQDVRDACDARSLAELAWDLEQAWELAGAKKKDEWMIFALAHLADDEITRRTTPAISDPRIVQVLHAIGTDAAAMELMTIAGRASHFYGAAPAESALARIAKARGITLDELEDRVTPTVDLDEDGTTTLDYGTRILRVGFDSRLEPYVLTEKDERLRQLPPRRKKDVPERVEIAQARWRDLKEDVATIASRRMRALERAMREGRTWSRADFETVWVRHPLLSRLARTIVWISDGTSFRIAEDHSFANENDETIHLPESARIGVAHRIEMERAIEKWQRIFDDYQIVSPIDQLGRATYALTMDEYEVSSFTRAVPVPFPFDKIAWLVQSSNLVDAGWDGGQRAARMLLARSKGSALVRFRYNDQKVDAVTVVFANEENGPLLGKNVHPIEASEILRVVFAAVS